MADREWDVVVIGAGVSGCVAAYELGKAGLKVAIVEANSRYGGRTQTIKAQDGNNVDLGGQWVFKDQQKNIMALLKELDIQTYPQYCTGKKRLEMKDKSMSEYSSTIPSLPLHSLIDLQLNVITKVNSLLSQIPLENPYSSEKALEYDSMTAADLINRFTWTNPTRQMVAVAVQTIWGVEVEEISALFFLWYVKTAGNLTYIIETEGGAQQDRIKGGTGIIFERLLPKIEALGVELFLSSPVKSIIHSSGPAESNEAWVEWAEVRTGEGESEKRFKTRRVIAAVSPYLLGNVEFSPPLPTFRQEIMKRGGPGSLLKCIIFYNTPFWRKKGYSGQLVCYGGDVKTQPVNLAYDASGEEIGVNWADPWQERGMEGDRIGRHYALVAFISASFAIYWGERDPTERKNAILAHLARHFGKEALKPIDYLEKDWSTEKYTKGCPVHSLPPGALLLASKLSPRVSPYILREPHGLCHFAATETATEWVGYMDGAVQSGKRAAKEVLDKLRKKPVNV